MQKTNKLWIWALFVFFCTGQVIAGNRPGAFTLTLANGFYHFAPSRHLENTFLPNAALAYNFTDRWAIEGEVGVVNTNQRPVLTTNCAGVHGFLYTVDSIYRFLPYQQWEPYVIAGVGVLAMKPNGLNSEHQGNVNAGIGTQIFFSDGIALRGEIRDLYTTTGSGENDYMINFGVSFLIGRKG
ncbi:MAG: hypothetical protein K0S27_245 [Gammaproteobacteria bacterium]|jgi:hypothetical protein|nr:hypothetical protein [Gammaproteobacteria bacterium]